MLMDERTDVLSSQALSVIAGVLVARLSLGSLLVAEPGQKADDEHQRHGACHCNDALHSAVLTPERQDPDFGPGVA